MAEGQSASQAERPIGMIQDLEPGTRLRLTGDRTAEVVANPKDGYWINVRYLSAPDDPSQEGTEELVFVTDVLAQLGSA